MKKLWIGAVLGLLFLGSCAQNKEKREEYKDEHDKSATINTMGDSVVANSEKNPAKKTDTVKMKTDSPKAK